VQRCGCAEREWSGPRVWVHTPHPCAPVCAHHTTTTTPHTHTHTHHHHPPTHTRRTPHHTTGPVNWEWLFVTNTVIVFVTKFGGFYLFFLVYFFSPNPLTLLQALKVYQYTTEFLEMLIVPMATSAYEALGSMGTDTALACFSKQPRRLADYFKQLFAQVCEGKDVSMSVCVCVCRDKCPHRTPPRLEGRTVFWELTPPLVSGTAKFLSQRCWAHFSVGVVSTLLQTPHPSGAWNRLCGGYETMYTFGVLTIFSCLSSGSCCVNFSNCVCLSAWAFVVLFSVDEALVGANKAWLSFFACCRSQILQSIRFEKVLLCLCNVRLVRKETFSPNRCLRSVPEFFSIIRFFLLENSER
jgi:hypothetical protein